MVFNIIPIVLIILSIVVILVIIIRRFPDLALIDVETIPEEREKKVKERIVKERFVRKFFVIWRPFIKICRLFFDMVRKKFRLFHKKVKEKERSYKKPKTIKSVKERIVFDDKIQKIFQYIDTLLKEDNFKEAEKQYIKILEMDSKNIVAYKGLVNVYIKLKDIEHAKETLEYLLQLAPQDDEVYSFLGQIAFNERRLKEAEQYYLRAIEFNRKKVANYLDLFEVYQSQESFDKAKEIILLAAKLEPNSPKILDALVQISIITKDKSLALESWRHLKEVNPENQKLESLKREIQKIS